MKNEEGKNPDDALKRALAPLRRFISALRKGITEKEFRKRFKWTYVTPGVSAGQFLTIEQLAGNVARYDNGTIKLRPQNTSLT